MRVACGRTTRAAHDLGSESADIDDLRNTDRHVGVDAISHCRKRVVAKEHDDEDRDAAQNEDIRSDQSLKNTAADRCKNADSDSQQGTERYHRERQPNRNDRASE